MLTLAALLPSALNAQDVVFRPHENGTDQVLSYTRHGVDAVTTVHAANTPHAANSFYAANAVHATSAACNTCHQASPFALDLMLNPESPKSFLDLVYSTAYSKTPPPSAPLRIGKVTFVPLGNELIRSHLPLKDEAALIVSAVDSEAELVKPGDVLLTVNQIPVSQHAKILVSVEEDREKPALLAFIRGGKKMEADVPGSLLARPEQPYLIGVQVEQPGDALRSQLRLYENEGLLITEVVEDSAAEKAGFEKHDILLRAGDQRISTLDDLRACVNASKGEAVELTFMRGGKEQKLSATPERQEVAVVAADVYGVCPRVSNAELLFLGSPVEVELDDGQAGKAEKPESAESEE